MGWSTKNEMDYVDALASGECRKWVNNSACMPETSVMLSNYIKGAKARKENGTFQNDHGMSVDADKVIQQAERHLQRLTAA